MKPAGTAFLIVISEKALDFITYLKELLIPNKPEQQNNAFWFPTPKSSSKTRDQNSIQTRSLREMHELRTKENLNAKDDEEFETKFLKRFDLTDTLLTEAKKQAIEDNLVASHNISNRHKMDIELNTQFIVKLAPKNEKVDFSQSISMPFHLKENLSVQLALMQIFGIIAVLPFSNYAIPVFPQRKRNGKMRLLVDLRKINSLIEDDCTDNNHPVSILSDAGPHLAGKPFFCKLDCS